MTVTLEAPIPRLLAGPDPRVGPEPYADHVSRLGRLPRASGRSGLVDSLEASGLLGRGGAGFPVGKKWRSVAERAIGPGAVVLVNGAEGEPLSSKDQALMTLRPHLVLDGAELAADAVGADEIILYVGEAHATAHDAIARAIGERRAVKGHRAPAIRLVLAPHRYIAGEESAAVHAINAGDARPVTTPPRPYERGVGGRPTLVQNVESLAYAALIGRFGDGWYRQAGRFETRGTGLVTTSGPTGRPVVHEVELGVTIGEIAALAGPDANRDRIQAVLVGGYFGGWVGVDRAWNMALDPARMRAIGWAFGCGVVGFLSAEACPVSATARIADYMAGQSAAQCGPCVFGLRSIADATTRIAGGMALRDDLANLERWAGQVRNRGACRHPDGAVGLLTRALETFGPEFQLHQRSRRCSHPGRRARIGNVA